MENPFRSEAAAFRFLLITIAAFAAIALASYLNDWAGLAVFILVTAAAIAFYLYQRGERAPKQRVEHRGQPDEKRILVIANETVAGRQLLEEIKRAAAGYRADVLVVAPVLSSRVHLWTSDVDKEREEAQRRLDESLARLREAGIEARGQIGDENPLQAMEDALRTFGADEIVISTHPAGRSSWLERGVVERARERFDVTIKHVVVDLRAEAAQAG